jgi:hypothetical protein
MPEIIACLDSACFCAKSVPEYFLFCLLSTILLPKLAEAPIAPAIAPAVLD